MNGFLAFLQIALILLLGYLVRDLPWLVIISIFGILIAYAVISTARFTTK